MSTHSGLSAALARLDDHELARLVDAAPAIGSGIGGATALVEIAGTPVFVKRIPLTELELQPENVRSTANVFGLPMGCHYGVVAYGSAGFGAWRELAANVITTAWVLAGQTEAFPLMYHSRVLPGAAPLAAEQADVDRVAAYWDSSAVRRRLDALAQASASVVLFLEYLPQTVDAWLTIQLAAGPDATAAACAMVAQRLQADIAFMNANGLRHFDGHFRNLLTDGERLYFADLGLAASTDFDLLSDERDFLDVNESYDFAYAVTELVNWMVVQVVGITATVERNDYIRRCAAGARPTGVAEPMAALISQYAPVATVMNDFFWELWGTSRTTSYPARIIAGVFGTDLVPER